MFVTVAICTRNRAASLGRTLQSLSDMERTEALNWELIVVDNGSTDLTPAVCNTFSKILSLRRVFEPRAGLSNARNAAVAAARGDYIVWTDDDVVVGREWLAAYVEAFCRRPEAAFFGGPIRARYEEPVVKWVAESEALLGGPFCIRDLGDESVPLSTRDNRLPMGANMALRGAEQRAFRYNPELGVGTGPGGHRGGEEHELIERVMAAGGLGYPVPKACVEHCIGRDRQDVNYLFRWFAGAGDQDAFITRRSGVPQQTLLGAPRWLWRGLIESWLLYRFHRLVSPGPVWVKHLKMYAYASGALRYWLGEGLVGGNARRS